MPTLTSSKAKSGGKMELLGESRRHRTVKHCFSKMRCNLKPQATRPLSLDYECRRPKNKKKPNTSVHKVQNPDQEQLIGAERQHAAQEAMSQALARLKQIKPAIGMEIGLKASDTRGVRVLRVRHGASAWLAGITTEHYIQQVDGVFILNNQVFKDQVLRKLPGDEIVLTVADENEETFIRSIVIGGHNTSAHEVGILWRIAHGVDDDPEMAWSKLSSPAQSHHRARHRKHRGAVELSSP